LLLAEFSFIWDTRQLRLAAPGKSIFGPSILLDVQGYVIKKENEIPLFLFFIKILSAEYLFLMGAVSFDFGVSGGFFFLKLVLQFVFYDF
jgi:hypothetical protein